jgi:hypothetical protein
MLFRTFERTDPEPSRHSESTFQFLDRCKSTAVDKIRIELERWLDNYPTAHREELVSRFPDEFYSPFFELLLHELLIRQGCKVTVHPDIGTRGKHPDFSIRPPGTARTVILEATLCFDDPEEDSTSRRMAPVYDAINGVGFSFCALLVSQVTFKSPDSQPSSRRIKAFLDRELSNLDPETLLRTVTQATDMPCLHFEDDCVVIDFEIVPRKREAWERTDLRAIGMHPTRVRWGDGKESLRKTLSAKAKYYGQVGEPFIIAVNTLSPWGSRETEWSEALFGTREEYVPAGTDSLCVRYLNDGFWGNAEAPKYKRVSAVIFGCALPYNVPRICLVLFRNPWAAHPLPEEFWRLPVVDVSNGKVIKENEGIRVGDILRLSSDWPGELFSERRSRHGEGENNVSGESPSDRP